MTPDDLTYDEMEAELEKLPIAAERKFLRTPDGSLRRYLWKNAQGREILVQIEPEEIDDLTLLFDCWHAHYACVPPNRRESFAQLERDLMLLVDGNAFVYELFSGKRWIVSALCPLEQGAALRETVLKSVMEGGDVFQSLLRAQSVAHCRFWDPSRDQDLVFDLTDLDGLL